MNHNIQTITQTLPFKNKEKIILPPIFPKILKTFDFTAALIFSSIFKIIQDFEGKFDANKEVEFLSLKTKKEITLILREKTHNYLSFVFYEEGHVWVCIAHHNWTKYLWGLCSISTFSRSIRTLIKHGLIIKKKNHSASVTSLVALTINFEKLQEFLKDDD